MSAPSSAPATSLDVRDVPPKDRFELIMGAYDALAPGASMILTVDHDPLCMYYTLKATRAEDGFTFDYLERGSDPPSAGAVWRVRVGRRRRGDARP